MNAPLAMAAETVTVVDISAALRLHRTSVFRRSEKESWPYDEVGIRGGRQRLYALPIPPSPPSRPTLPRRWRPTARSTKKSRKAPASAP